MTYGLTSVLSRLPVVAAMASRRDFAPAGIVHFVVDFDGDGGGDGSMNRYREAQDWCAQNCIRRWSAAPERQIGRAGFSFEDEVDAVHFALRWA